MGGSVPNTNNYNRASIHLFLSTRKLRLVEESEAQNIKIID